MKKIALVVVLAVATSAIVNAANEKQKLKKQDGKTFYVYTERGSRENHYIPSGYMGDWSDIKMNQGWEKNPGRGKYCIRIDYSGERKQGAGWGGVYWQHPANSWGDKRGGYNLDEFKKLKFMARSDKGGEVIDKFGFGGITGQTEDGDSDQAEIGPIELTKEWKEYEIDLRGLDLSHIIGGFVWAANGDMNPQGFTIYLDEVRYER